MNPEARAKLIDAIIRLYTVAHLGTVVQKILGCRLEQYSALTDAPTTVDNFLAALERQPDDRDRFLSRLRVLEIRLCAAIDAYYGMPGDPEPYDALMVLDLPFVDRKPTRDKLRELFQKENRRAMVVRGARATGKSHSRWLFEHVARSEGIDSVFVELKYNSVEEVVTQLINDLSLPPREFRDRLAQATTMTKGFVSALRGAARQMPAQQRWCLIFDSYDYDTVDNAMRDFVDALLAEVADLQMKPIWMIVLGHRAAAPVVGATQPSARLIKDDILQLTEPDIKKFLEQLTEQKGVTFAATASTDIVDALTLPLDHGKMARFAERLREKLEEAGL
jgi:hypothetical protein